MSLGTALLFLKDNIYMANHDTPHFSTRNAIFRTPLRFPEPPLQICIVAEPSPVAEIATVGMPFVPYVPLYDMMDTCTIEVVSILLLLNGKPSHPPATVVPVAVVITPEYLFTVTPV